MPIYEYQCAECSGKFEVLTSFSQRDRAHACPNCESSRTEVMVSRFASIGGDSSSPMDFGAPAMGGGGGCACGGACSCGGH